MFQGFELKKIKEAEWVRSNIACVVVAVCFMLAFSHYFFADSAREVSTVMNLLIMVFVYLLMQRTEDITGSARKYAFVFGMIFSVMLVVGRQVYETNKATDLFVSLKSILGLLISLVGFGAVFTAFFAFIFNWFISKDESNRKKEENLWPVFRIKGVYFIIWLFIFATWLPAFFAYYPGIFSYDMPVQTWQAMGGIAGFTKFHPPLHTYIWYLCMKLQDVIGLEAVSIYALVQMFLLSAAMACIVKFLINKKVKNWIILVSLLFVSINPVIAIFSIVPTKDVYFAGFFVVTIIQICKLCSDPEGWLSKVGNYIVLGILILFSCLFRNNAVYAFILGIPVLVAGLRKHWKRVLPVTLVPVICFCFINSVVYTRLGIQDGDIKEIICVPFQQIANVTANKGEFLTEEEREAISKYLNVDDMAAWYNPRFADPVKTPASNEAVKEGKAEFFGLWFRLFLKYPGEYVNAFLSLNLPYWYVDSATLDPYSARAYIETGIYGIDAYSFERDNVFPKLLEFYEKVASYEMQGSIPVVSTLYSLTTPIWLIFFCIFLIMAKGYKKGVLVFAVPCFLWFTYLAGPVSNFRYILPLFLLYPLLLAIMFNTDKFFKKSLKKLPPSDTIN